MLRDFIIIFTDETTRILVTFMQEPYTCMCRTEIASILNAIDYKYLIILFDTSLEYINDWYESLCIKGIIWQCYMGKGYPWWNTDQSVYGWVTEKLSAFYKCRWNLGFSFWVGSLLFSFYNTLNNPFGQQGLALNS